jgi:hypothetical protein
VEAAGLLACRERFGFHGRDSAGLTARTGRPYRAAG